MQRFYVITTALVGLLVNLSVLANEGTPVQVLNHNGNLSVVITKTAAGAAPISVLEFAGQAPGFNQVIAGDLTRSAKFASSTSGLAQTRLTSSKQLDLKLWQGTNHIVLGKVSPGNGMLRYQYELVDVKTGRTLLREQVQAPANRTREVAHLIADKVYEVLTGVKGDFSGKIAYVLKSATRQFYQIQIADTDGQAPLTVFKSTQPIMSPVWAPNGKQLAYVSFETGKASIYLQNIATGQREELTPFAGFSSAPAFSPDGKYLAFTSSMQGNADIYQMHLASRKISKLIEHSAIDTEASYAPDGKSLVFTSDRGGSAQVYEFDIASQSAKRLTFAGKFSGKAVFSPNMRSIAFIQNTHGYHYQMSIMNRNTGTVQVLSNTFNDDSPAFSPSGSMIAYGSSHAGKGFLAIVSSDGRFNMQLPALNGTVSEPTWQPK